MSDAGVIHDMSKTLQSILDVRLNTTHPFDAGSAVGVTIDSPHRVPEGTGDLRVNLFLYQVLQDEGRRNSGGWIPLQRTQAAQLFAPEPLALRLYYLMTTFAKDGLIEHRLLGAAMQGLYVHRRVPEDLLQGTLKASPIRADHVQLTLLNLDIDTLQKIWGSQNEPMRTSVAYEVEAVFIDADEASAEVRLVEERKLEVVPVPYLSLVSPEAAAPGATVRVYGANLALQSPIAGQSMLRIWFGNAEAELLPDNQSGGAVNVRVPQGLSPGRVRVRVQLDRYVSRSVPFEVLGPV